MNTFKKTNWTNEEIEFLKKNYVDMCNQEISLALNRSPLAVKSKAENMGLRKGRMKIWTSEEFEYLKARYGTVKAEEIAKILNRNVDSILNKAREIKDKKRYIENGWSEDDMNFLKENYSKMDTKEIAKILGRTVESVTLKANRNGLSKPNKYSYDKGFFKEINTEEKAYWLGFVYADGYVTGGESNYEFAIELQASDILHLEKLNKSLKGNVKPTFKKKKVGETSKKIGIQADEIEMCTIRFYSKEMVENLIKVGVVYNKTSSLQFPNFINDNLMNHFIRGFMDGDGYLTFKKRETYCHGYGYATRAGFICHSEEFTIDMKEYIESIVGDKLVLYEDKGSYKVDTSNQVQLLKFIEYLYKDATIYLDRKYETYKQLHHYLNNKSTYRKRNPKK